MVEKGRIVESCPERDRYNYSLLTGFTQIDIYSEDGIAPNPSDILASDHNFERRLPGGLKIDSGSEQEPGVPRIELALQDNSQTALDMIDPKSFVLSGPFDNKDFALRLPYIAYNVSEKARQDDLAMTSLHAASVVTPDGRSVLILGDKGSGKSLMSLTFGLDYDFGLIGNDLVLADDNNGQLFLRAGNQIFDVRQAAIKYYLPDLYRVDQGKPGNPYEEKMTLIPEEIGISIGEDMGGLSSVVRVNVHPLNDKTEIEKGARKIQEILRLREDASRYIRGVVTPLRLDEESYEGYFPSMDTDALTKQRDKMIEQIMESNFIYAYGNNPKEIASEIINSTL